MKTQVKGRNQDTLFALTTDKNNKYKGQKLLHKTLQQLSVDSEPGNLYSIFAYPIAIQAGKNTSKFVLTLTDGTKFLPVLNGFHDAQWIHKLKENEYYQFILHCRRNINQSDVNQFYIQKVNTILDFNALSFHLLKIMNQEATKKK